MSRRTSNTIAGLFSLLIVGGMALGMTALFGLGLKNIWRGIASSGWPTTEAVVAKVEMTSNTTRDTRSQRSTTTYNADLEFRYQAGRRTFTTDQVRWGQTLGSGDPAEAVVQALNYPEGRRVMVRYNPAKPEEAVVRPGLTGSAFLLPGAAIAFLMFLLPACIMIWRMFLGPGVNSPSLGFPDMTRVMRVFLGVPILMGAAMAIVGTQNLRRAAASRTWPSTSGAWLRDLPTNQVAGIDAVRDHRGFDYVYQYTRPSGPRYECTRWFGQGTASGNNSDAEIETEFPRGKPLTVYYHPEEPDTAVLSPGIRRFAWILPGAGLGFMLFGVAGIWTIGHRGDRQNVRRAAVAREPRDPRATRHDPKNRRGRSP
ncbi:MAG: DUF3592 domain-containing protein [Verrucomicrobiales bacterium]|nr:DUF3592 domain-containing protein [Verrucomicrobiales bacterium]